MRFLLLLLLSGLSFSLSAQILDPVSWETSVEKISDTEYDLIATATMEDGWTIYSQFTDDNGPVPTYFEFEPGDHYERVGEVTEKGKKKEGPDPLFGDVVVIKYVASPVTFTQRVKVSDINTPIKGYLEYMTCDDSRCLPPTEFNLKYDLSALSEEKSAEKTKEQIQEQASTGKDQGLLIQEQEEIEEVKTTGTLGKNIKQPVTWSIQLRPIEEGTYDIAITADLEQGWTIYSQDTEDNGPIPTEFTFEDAGNGYTLEGKVEEEGKFKEGPDAVFGGVFVKKYVKGPVLFKQRIRVTDNKKEITGNVYFMACDASKCLPPEEVPFTISLASGTATIGAELASPEEMAAQEDKGLFYINRPDLDAVEAECSVAVVEKSNSYWSIFFLGFLGGLIALLTPCVFPMIPLTVSFFTKGSENKQKGLTNAFLYGFFIFLVYLLLSVPFHLMDSINPDILNDISTNVWLNIAFFLIFLFFAFSFFGYYEITLPASWTNKASSAEGVGGILGIFFMALTLALVSFSCTGPILGSLLAGALSSDGGAMQLTMGMGGFGLALALPFGLFAAFPGWMNTLPSSGGWLNSVKVVLGFVELALAFKFLSNADLVQHWGFLTVEVFLGIWIVTAIGLGLYLFGKIKFPHDSPIKKLGLTRIVLGTASFAFALYLMTGFIFDEKANSLRSLTLLSGLAPPACYSMFYPCDCPQNLNCFKDFNQGMAYAKKVNKPVMIDFTGHACVNCRKMEEQVWPKSEVYGTLKEDYILISLYVDEDINLPEEEQVEVIYTVIPGKKRLLETVGDKWSYFETEYFETNTQPYYVLLSPEGEMLNRPVGYTPDAEEYADFLECGLQSFERISQETTPSEGQKLGLR
ncbi:MAG: cytochrome c biogenesis protein CcdA [Bacteroidota bacterium]